MAFFLDCCRGATFSHDFLMSAAARTLSLVDLCDLSGDAAHKMLCGMRWPDTGGAPVCPNCSCAAVYTYRCRRVFKCQGLPSAVFSDQRDLARLLKASVSDPAHGLQSVRQRRHAN